jgi:hypothetical protein
MGLEATCRVRSGATTHEAKVLLETDELIVRGAARQRIPLSAISNVAAADGELRVDHGSGTLVFELGEAAEKWAQRIRSPRTLLEKLGVHAGQTISVRDVSDEEFATQLTGSGARVYTGAALKKDSDIIFLGATTPRDLAKLGAAAKAIKRDGAIWVIHPKGKDALRDTEIFAAAKELGLTATKVARFSATHTAEKLVIPVARR